MNLKETHNLPEKVIFHIDMDAFFASCEESLRPELRKKPLIVGGTKEDVRSIVACPNYLARAKGVRTAMALTKAMQLCPDGNFIRSTRGLYSSYSKKVREIFFNYSPQVQPVSIDEAYMDVTKVLHLYNYDPVILANKIKDEIKNTLDITCSIGISTSKISSKIASKENKPDGITLVPFGKEKEFLSDLKVERIPGVGKAMLPKLQKYGIYKIGDILKFNREFYEGEIGDYSGFIYNVALGLDKREVRIEEEDRKSLSKENTFNSDTNDMNFLRRELNILLEKACFRLRKEKLLAKTITVKAKGYDFLVVQKSYTRPVYSNLESEMYEDVMQLLESVMKTGKKVRLIGIKLSELIDESEYIQEEMFMDVSTNKRLTENIDKLRNKFSFDIIKFGRSMK
ncbi:MAG TPA: DNA polymerase IV [Ignavibacteria bacterium]|nr:DNA polymerase IV [Ignavibacteria bacterium]